MHTLIKRGYTVTPLIRKQSTDLYDIHTNIRVAYGTSITPYDDDAMCKYISSNHNPTNEPYVVTEGSVKLLSFAGCILTVAWFAIDEKAAYVLTQNINELFYGQPYHQANAQYSANRIQQSKILPHLQQPYSEDAILNQSGYGTVETVVHPVWKTSEPLDNTPLATDHINNIPNQPHVNHNNLVVKLLMVYWSESHTDARTRCTVLLSNLYATHATAIVEQKVNSDNTWFMYTPYIHTSPNGQKVLALKVSKDLMLTSAATMSAVIAGGLVGRINYLTNLINNSSLLPQQPCNTLSNISTPRKTSVDMYRSVIIADHLFANNAPHDDQTLTQAGIELSLLPYPSTNDLGVSIYLYHMDVWYTTYGYTYDQW